MKKTNNKSLLSVILSFVLIAVIALTMFGCTGNKNADTTTTEATVQTTEATSPIIIGEGEVQISFSVTHKDGSVAEFIINKKPLKNSLAAAGGAFLGFILGTGLKLAVSGTLFYYTIRFIFF